MQAIIWFIMWLCAQVHCAQLTFQSNHFEEEEFIAKDSLLTYNVTIKYETEFLLLTLNDTALSFEVIHDEHTFTASESFYEEDPADNNNPTEIKYQHVSLYPQRIKDICNPLLEEEGKEGLLEEEQGEHWENNSPASNTSLLNNMTDSLDEESLYDEVPPNTPPVRCEFQIRIQNSGRQEVGYKLQGVKGEVMYHNEEYDGFVKKNQTIRYAFYLTTRDLPAGVVLVPDENERDMDLDLFVYTESNPLSFVFPNAKYLNHYLNYEEVAVIQEEDEYWEEGMYYAEVQAVDTKFSRNTYTVTLVDKYETPPLLGLSIFGVLGALMILLLCLFASAAIMARRRRLSGRGVQMERIGATKKQLKALPVSEYSGDYSTEDAKCAICLDDYKLKDKIRSLHCSHHFHKICVDQWLENHSNCPLCLQNVGTGSDVRQSNTDQTEITMEVT